MKILDKFPPKDVKTMKTYMPSHFNLPESQSPKHYKEHVNMSRVTHASVIGSLIYSMVYTRLALSNGSFEKLILDPGKHHHKVVKYFI